MKARHTILTHVCNNHTKGIDSDTLGVDNLHLAYADDIAMVLRDLWHIGPSICKLFDLVGTISALFLNLNKCVCIPLWNFSECSVRTSLRRLIPAWSNFVIRGHGKYLGFQVGPSANTMEWDKIKSDVLKVARMIKDLHLPVFHSMLLFVHLLTL